MRLIDISKELLSCDCYPGDLRPRLNSISKIAEGDECNLSELYCCLHNGTHLDAPLHFLENGVAADKISLDKCIGTAKVVEVCAKLNREKALAIIKDNPQRLLIKGNAEISLDAATLFADSIKLLGVEGLTVGNQNEIGDVHKVLLKKGVVILENLDLTQAEQGEYFLFAPPIKIANACGAPVRAVLIQNEIRGNHCPRREKC
ncbi:MAG: cyclase family protein [Clostridia bacterium]|nr:cyclase family protein [Clostridia bacterium]